MDEKMFKSKEEFKKAWIEYTAKASGISDLDYLSNAFEKSFKNNNVDIYNSVRGTNKKIDSLLLLENIKRKYIVSENGSFFINHNIYTAPVVVAYDTFKKSRKKNKDLMKKAQENNDNIGEAYYYNAQLDDKTNQNTFYGAQLNIFSKYYNYDVAASITIRGRSTVSTCGLTIEACFGRYRPHSIQAHTHFINECIAKDISKYEKLLKTPTVDEILVHMLGKYYDGYYRMDTLKDILNKLDDSNKKKIYYANNFKAFLQIDRVKYIINEIMKLSNKDIHKLNDLEAKNYYKYLFINPSRPPESMSDLVKEYSDMSEALLTGYYWFEGDTTPTHNYTSTQEIFKNIERELILITDTDSLIVYLYGCVLPMISLIDVDISNLDEDNTMYILSSLVILSMDLLNKAVLGRYTVQAQIPKEYRHIINYKQEFVYRLLQLTKSAKNYLGTIKIQEGVYFEKERVDIKGLSLKKGNFNKRLSDIAKEVSIENILKEKKPDINSILNLISEKRNEILELYKSTKNIELFTVNKIKKPYGIMDEGDYRMKAVRLYNRLYNDTIPLPGAFLLTNIKFLDRVDDIEENYPDKYKLLEEEVLHRCITSNKKSLINRIEKYVANDHALYLNETKRLFIKEKTNLDYKEKYLEEVVAINKLIHEDIEKATSVEALKELIKDARKYTVLGLLFKKYSFKSIKIENIEKIAIPLESESVDDFITDFMDSDDIAVFENLAAVVVQGIGLEVVRNKKKKRQILTNIVSYY